MSWRRPSLGLRLNYMSQFEEDFENLSGSWTGVYDYPDHALDPVSFKAILIDANGAISGEIIEPNSSMNIAGKFLSANITGTVDGNYVRFVKFYEDYSQEFSEVVYEGTVDQAKTTIKGEWTTIEEMPWKGPFVMNRVRVKAAQKAAEREVTAPR
jgi:hypothetical protein